MLLYMNPPLDQCTSPPRLCPPTQPPDAKSLANGVSPLQRHNIWQNTLKFVIHSHDFQPFR